MTGTQGIDPRGDPDIAVILQRAEIYPVSDTFVMTSERLRTLMREAWSFGWTSGFDAQEKFEELAQTIRRPQPGKEQ